VRLVADLEIPGLRHFVYKSCAAVQLTQPVWSAPYEAEAERLRCVALLPSMFHLSLTVLTFTLRCRCPTGCSGTISAHMTLCTVEVRPGQSL
jgi:hypothetical protein